MLRISCRDVMTDGTQAYSFKITKGHFHIVFNKIHEPSHPNNTEL